MHVVQDTGGVLLVTPESRCSLQLQMAELARQTAIAAVLVDLDALPYQDVFDESDGTTNCVGHVAFSHFLHFPPAGAALPPTSLFSSSRVVEGGE